MVGPSKIGFVVFQYIPNDFGMRAARFDFNVFQGHGFLVMRMSWEF
jgi:hypothetical protein